MGGHPLCIRTVLLSAHELACIWSIEGSLKLIIIYKKRYKT